MMTIPKLTEAAILKRTGEVLDTAPYRNVSSFEAS
jgi:hypothetical protein